MTTKEQIEHITRKVDLVSIILQYSELRTKASNLIGKCPFCFSQTFTVSVNKRIFKCFKCQKGGNIINFIKELEDLSFLDTLDFILTKFQHTLGGASFVETNLRGTVYVLELEDAHYYIGFTRQLERRMESHFNGKGALWTKKYKPISIMETYKDRTLVYENILTEKFIDKYGYDKVRGGDHLYFYRKYGVAPIV